MDIVQALAVEPTDNVHDITEDDRSVEGPWLGGIS